METLALVLAVIALLLVFGGQRIGYAVGAVIGGTWRFFLGRVREVGDAARGNGRRS